MREKKVLFLECFLVFVLLFVSCTNNEQDISDDINQITKIFCTEKFKQKFGETDSQALEEKMKKMLNVEILEQAQEQCSVRIVSDYSEAIFCFDTEQAVKTEECSIFLEIPELEHRFYDEDYLANIYLQLENKDYLLGTAWIEDEMYFLPLSEYEIGIFYDDMEIQKMLGQYEMECDDWRYVWVDGWKNDNTLYVRNAQKIDTELPGELWGAVEESETEILLDDEETKIICVDLKDGHEEGYRETSFKNFHSILKEGGSNVYFVGWKDGKVECVINIFIS